MLQDFSVVVVFVLDQISKRISFMKSTNFRLKSDVNLIKNFDKNKCTTYSFKLLVGKFQVFCIVVLDHSAPIQNGSFSLEWAY